MIPALLPSCLQIPSSNFSCRANQKISKHRVSNQMRLKIPTTRTHRPAFTTPEASTDFSSYPKLLWITSATNTQAPKPNPNFLFPSTPHTSPPNKSPSLMIFLPIRPPIAPQPNLNYDNLSNPGSTVNHVSPISPISTDKQNSPVSHFFVLFLTCPASALL